MLLKTPKIKTLIRFIYIIYVYRYLFYFTLSFDNLNYYLIIFKWLVIKDELY